ncbi:hypothetical protein PRIC2_006505 [Phytophthora ramorum]
MNGAASKPPLPHRPPGSSRNLKQREREVPHVDWEHSLQHFAACISAELDALHRRFMEQNAISFAAWKRLWTDAKMSAAFHVEFWESSPTSTHKTILQQALDGLVWCIEERNGEFDNAADVAALTGRVFAMYCAYSVQLSSPKHKIDVDPQAWTALLTINCVMCGVGAALFPSAAREVRAMMHRLVIQESAFLRCLQGFGPSIRLQERAPRSQGGDARQDSLLDSLSRSEEDAPVKQSKVDQLKALNDRYQELMNRTRSAGPSVSASSARLGGRRTQPAVSASLLSSVPSPGTGTDGQELAHALTTFMEYKANDDARKIDRVARAAAARKTTPRTASARTSIQAVQPRLRRSSRFSSVASEADSNALEELEKELQATAATLAPVQPQAEPIKPPRKRGAVTSKGPVQHDVAEEESIDLAWRVELLRALITADLANVERVILAHIEVISAPFTTAMPPWALQWEGMHWWMLQDATPLFVASAYSRPEIVNWLLINGADRLTPCYLKQPPLKVVGECCAHAALPDRNRDGKRIVADSANCVRLLDEPPTLPLPPTKDVAFSSSYSSEVVIARTGFNSSSIQQTVYKCLLRASWQTPLSNGAIIDKYELRYRRLVTEDEGEASTDQDRDKEGVK